MQPVFFGWVGGAHSRYSSENLLAPNDTHKGQAGMKGSGVGHPQGCAGPHGRLSSLVECLCKSKHVLLHLFRSLDSQSDCEFLENVEEVQ